jgi:hypothetical protein
MFEELYNSHKIFIGFNYDLDSDTYTPDIYISFPHQEYFRHIKLIKTFATMGAALDRALALARKWIDEGKPELFPERVDSDAVVQ